MHFCGFWGDKPLIRLDLQLFTGEKTEKATPKKRDDARKEGQVARSQEFGQAIVLLAGLLTIKLLAGFYMEEFVKMFKQHLSDGLLLHITEQSVLPFFVAA